MGRMEVLLCLHGCAERALHRVSGRVRDCAVRAWLRGCGGVLGGMGREWRAHAGSTMRMFACGRKRAHIPSVFIGGARGACARAWGLLFLFIPGWRD